MKAIDDIADKIDRAIALEISMAKIKKDLDSIKAELQAEALAELENKSLKYVQLFGKHGSFEVAHKVKFEVDNFGELVETIGKLAIDKVTREESVKYKVESRFKDALVALVQGDYAAHDVKVILTEAGIADEKAMKLALKKLKGDYKKDKAFLESIGLTGDMEEELDAIREAKNQELIERFFDVTAIDIERLKRSIFVEDSLSVGLTYEA